MELHGPLQEFNELLGHDVHVVHKLIVKHRVMRVLLDGFSDELFSEELILHISHVRDHREPRGALDLDAVGPALAQEVVLLQHLGQLLGPGHIRVARQGLPGHLKEADVVVRLGDVLDLHGAVLLLGVHEEDEVLREDGAAADLRQRVEEQEERVVVLRGRVLLLGLDVVPQVRQLVLQDGVVLDEVHRVQVDRLAAAAVRDLHLRPGHAQRARLRLLQAHLQLHVPAVEQPADLLRLLDLRHEVQDLLVQGFHGLLLLLLLAQGELVGHLGHAPPCFGHRRALSDCLLPLRLPLRLLLLELAHALIEKPLLLGVLLVQGLLVLIHGGVGGRLFHPLRVLARMPEEEQLAAHGHPVVRLQRALLALRQLGPVHQRLALAIDDHDLVLLLPAALDDAVVFYHRQGHGLDVPPGAEGRAVTLQDVHEALGAEGVLV
mmetsp:Transcript_45741/g.71564  ORF Transcript_45741/g.71564 Transcript_45741/m.71564 type:complete len:434 (-) Transcript_45741:235-1536(-)